MHSVMPRRSCGSVADHDLGQRVGAIGLDVGQQVQDLLLDARAAVRGEDVLRGAR